MRLNSCIATYMLELGGKYIRYPELQESSPCLFRDKVHLNSLGNSFFLHRIQQSFQDFLADDRVVVTPKAGDHGPWLQYAWLALIATTWFILGYDYLAFFTFYQLCGVTKLLIYICAQCCSHGLCHDNFHPRFYVIPPFFHSFTPWSWCSMIDDVTQIFARDAQ